jgi:sugar phosphate isomerase/epimerase
MSSSQKNRRPSWPNWTRSSRASRALSPGANPAAEVKDSDRLYPGDGDLPLAQMLKDLWKVGFRGPLSLEMFSDAEWKKSAAEVAKRGIEKMRAVIAKSGTEA